MAPSGAIIFLPNCFFKLLLRWLLPCVVGGHLVGCAANSSPLAEVLSAVVSDRFGADDAAINEAKLNSQYRYLRVDVVGRKSALLVLGYVDPHPHGDIEVWYSSSREVVKLQNGRIIGTLGLEVDWRTVRYDPAPPPWSDLPVQAGVYARSRDMMPGNRYAVTDRIELSEWHGLDAPVQGAKLGKLADKSGYRWFKEVSIGQGGLPASWYAVGLYQGRNMVVYTEQCLTKSLCLKLTRWPQSDSIL